MHALAITKLASPSRHRFSLAPDRFRHWFGNTHNPHIFHCFLTLPGTCDQSGVKSLRAHLAEKLQKSIAFNDVSSNLRGPLEAWGWEDKKNDQPKWTPKSPRHLRKTCILLINFVIFALRDPFGGRSRRTLHVQNTEKKHCIYRYFEKRRGTILRPQDGETKHDHPTWTPKSPQDICEKP